MTEQAIDIVIKAKDEASKALQKIQGSVSGLNGGLRAMGGVAKTATLALTTALAGVVGFGVKSAISIEQTRVAFENLYGDTKKAKDMMQSLSDFAKKTPFEFPELTDVALKLKNVAGVGDKQLIPMLTNLGDIASSQGKGISQIVEAYNDAITGEYERLKEFGIKASKSGNEVTLSFKGQQTTVKNTSAEIGKYLQELGQMGGIAGSMDKQSMTLGGRLSTLKDQFTSLSMAVIGVSETGDVQAGGMFDRLSKAVATVGTFLEQNSGKITVALQTITGVFATAFDIIYNVINNFLTGGTGDWVQFFNIVKQTVQVGLAIIQNFWKKYGADIQLVMSTLFGIIRGVITNFFAYIVPVIQSALGIIGNVFKFFASILRGDWSGAFEALKGIVKGAIEGIKNILKLGLNLILGIFGTNMTELKKNISIIWNQIKIDVSTALSTMATNAKEWGGNMIQMFVDGIREKVQALKDGIAEISTTISDYLGFHSPTKKGAGSDAHKWMPNLINMLVKGLNDGVPVIASAMATISAQFKKIDKAALKEALINVANAAKDAFSELTGKIGESKDKIKAFGDEIKGIKKTIDELNKTKLSIQSEGKAGIAGRALDIQGEMATLKASGKGSDEDSAKLLALEKELVMATNIAGQDAISLQVYERSKTETQKMYEIMLQKTIETDKEIVLNQKLLTEKTTALKTEERLFRNLATTKITLEKEYTRLFQENLTSMQTKIMDTIRMLQNLNNMSRGSGISASTTSAIITPSSNTSTGSGIVLPKVSAPKAPKAGPTTTIAINMGGVSVRNDQDIATMNRSIEDSLTRKLQLFKLGVL